MTAQGPPGRSETGFTPAPVAARPGRTASVLGTGLRRRGTQRGLSALVAVLLLAGGGLFAYPWFTDLWASARQDSLQGRFGSAAMRRDYLAGRIAVGQGLTELTIPSLGVHVLVVQGTTPAALQAGAGHYVFTPLPGQRGNVGIAGHRTTFGRPFNQLDRMRPGQTVVLTTPFDRYTYVVVPVVAGHANPWVVLPGTSSVVGQAGALGRGHWLTLTTCNPKGSDTQRLILRLRLARTVRLEADRVRGAGAPSGRSAAAALRPSPRARLGG